jgi:hypothetical protein
VCHSCVVLDSCLYGCLPCLCSGLEKELAALIGSQQIKARIDSHGKVGGILLW